MSALTVTLGADISALRRAMAGATELAAASARRMSKVTGAGLAGLGKGGAAALSKGDCFPEDINQLTGRGVPIIGELAKQFGVSDSQVKKLVESGQVGFPNIERAFISLTSKGGKFSGMMEAQSKTTKGLFSTLKDTFNEVLLALGHRC